MWVEKQNQYADFKNKFAENYGKPWEDARIDYFDPLVIDAIANVLAELNNTDASKYTEILDEIEDKQKQSIEDFCNRVQEYIKTKPAGFRLNFFVDEIGQYISENTKLMLNLQTIAETLATKTKGNSWILVTSQEDMEKVVGDMGKQQQNDFSRIQARFKIKIPLTSSNVDEVIEKRLLKKNNEVQKMLISTYKKDAAYLESLLSFSEAGVQFKGFASEEDYGNKFPFVPYQFDLFQQCRRALSAHNAFQGKHASVGERSMLGVFQQVVQAIEHRDDKALVSYDLMYEGIRNELRGEIQSSIILAERNLDNRFAVKVLKALFLVKYFGNFKTTKRNISVLMIDDINVDIKEHETKIAEALNTLENQSYVQRNGDFYEFLTDDEKDVEQEIKETDIDDQAITQLLKEILFDGIIGDNKLKFIDNKQNYNFTSKIDGSILGSEKELGIEIITENFYDYENETFIQSQTMGSTVMKMVMASDAIFMKDVRMYIRTNKYVKQSQSTSNRVEVKRILDDKAKQNKGRRQNLVLMANKSLAQATVFLNGSKLELGQTTEGKTRVINSFQILIKTVYPSLKMVGNTQYREDTIKTVIGGNQDELFRSDDSTMSEAESEILTLVNRRKKQSERTSLNDVKSYFVRKPYGWYQNAIWTIVAKLYKRGKVEIKQDSNLLNDADVLNALLNSSNYGNTLLEPQATYDYAVVKLLKQTYADAFDETCSHKEAKDVANAFKDKLKEMLIEINQLLAQKREYSFLTELESCSENISRLCKKEYSYFLTNLKDFEDDLLDVKEDLLAPIKRFMNGDQRGIYDSIRIMLNGDTSNLDYIKGNEIKILKDLLEHPKPFSGSLIKDAKAAKDELQKKVIAKINEEKTTAIDAYENAIRNLKSKDEFNALDAGMQNLIIKPLQEGLNKLHNQRYIANLIVARKDAEDVMNRQLNEMMRLATPVDDSGNVGIQEPKPVYIRRSSIKVDYPKTELKTENEVDEYVEALRKAYKDKIIENRRISLS
jgi:hypothetical protein